ncbi:hypothetical protein [Olleya sp. Bg11-27]|uniref:hypothetical protein n=1 Tax=Olleya sp. Bg11-27 TaxID=2058135 RepID=UPI000C30F944|nr:hypothetical protein [Olleya sp. Bg11-27]AUC75275.1 hypothetical protein CW732_06140 [Olleya sp. Bg11-27]
MNASINTQSFKQDSVINYSGILNSNYKSIVKQNFKNLKTTSLFSRKQHLKSWTYNRTCSIVATSLKVFLFIGLTLLAII